MLCARECPDWCIYIDSHKETIPATTEGGRERQRNVLDRFAIDFSLCMYCGICIEVCPFDALYWIARVRVRRARHPRPAPREGPARRVDGDRARRRPRSTRSRPSRPRSPRQQAGPRHRPGRCRRAGAGIKQYLLRHSEMLLLTHLMQPPSYFQNQLRLPLPRILDEKFQYFLKTCK